MLSIVDYAYDASVLTNIGTWGFGSDWPVVYITYNDNSAYVGETLDAVRRTAQHLLEPSFDQFSRITLISDRTFNKSVVLDLESFLIRYMSGDGTRRLTNGNAGIVNHRYFYREAYEDEFKEIWERLRHTGLVSRSILDIENSDLYKYSPYKTLTKEQRHAAYTVLRSLHGLDNAAMRSLVTITGGAGTGKSILAVYLVKLLADIARGQEVWAAVDDASEALAVRTAAQGLSSIRKVALVVPMRKLRETMREVFSSVDGLDASMVLAPEDVVKGFYDVLVVDEAHRLYRRKHLPGQHLYRKFDAINRDLMGDAMTMSEQDLTELDWVIMSSRMQVLFYDETQFIRVADIGRLRFEETCNPHRDISIELTSQMRCRGGGGYLDYVRRVIYGTDVTMREFKVFGNYELRVFDHVDDLLKALKERDVGDGLCKLAAGPGWGKDETIEVDGHTFRWASDGDDDSADAIWSVHKVQGFDLNYAGVIFGKEVFYDSDTRRIEVNKSELRDNFTKSEGAESMREFVLNIYVVLMTRGILGTFVYAVDDRLREYLMRFFR